MLSALTDTKNFVLGTVKEPFRRGARWGSATLGLMVPAVAVAIVWPPALMYFGLTVVAATVAGMATGAVMGGLKEVGKKRREFADSQRAATLAASTGAAYAPQQEHEIAHETQQESHYWRDRVAENEFSRMLQVEGMER
jgi:hypothetical protein